MNGVQDKQHDSINCNKNTACVKPSNSKYPNCPPRMDDGRHFTDYRPNCHMNNIYAHNEGLTNSFTSRMHLTHNAVDIMSNNRIAAHERNDCHPCQSAYQTGTMMREASALAHGATSVPCGEKHGIGIHPHVRSHVSDPLVCQAWNSGNSTATKATNCCLNQADLTDTYPRAAKTGVAMRLTSPSGGLIK